MELVFDAVPSWQLVVFAALFGAAWGSFSNVVITRWPAGLSVVRPASHCMACDRPIRFYDNIPVVSFLLLRGRCRHCGARFSPRYAVVELAMALLSVGVLRMTLLAGPASFAAGLTEYFIWFAFVWALVTAGLIDLETFLLPDAISLSGIAGGILANGLVFGRGWTDLDVWIDPLVAAAGSYATLSLLFVHGYRLLTGRAGMGEGDPKFVAMIGAFLGIEGALFALFAGALQGLIVGTILVIHRRSAGSGPEPPVPDERLDESGREIDADLRLRKARVPFGPFLALGAIEYFFFGKGLMPLYLDGAEAILSPIFAQFG